MDATFLKELSALLPADAVLTDPEDIVDYGTDWTKTPGMPGAVALPRTTAQVSQILALCSRLNVPVVPSGGRTGLAGGVVAKPSELALNLSRLHSIHDVSLLSRMVRVGAGAITENVHHACEAQGLTWPIDLASKGSCQIGGNLSTNAGGLRVIRYGPARKWVSSLEVVTMSGQVLELNADLEKNNTGYDLLQLLVGSEGTLAVITQATLKLVKIPQEVGKAVCFFAVDSLEGLPFLFESCRKGPFEILAFEFFSQACLNAVTAKLGRKSRLEKPGRYYVLAEIAGEQSRDGWLEQVLAHPQVVDATLAESSEDRKATWGLREGITESIALTGRVRKHDVCVPVAQAAQFLEEVEKAASKFQKGMALYFFGHFGDGSPHINLVTPPGVSADVFDATCDAFEPEMFAILQKYRGSISSEHGIGLLKKKWLGYSRSKTEIALFRSIKRALDPRGLLNPGKIFDL